MSGRVCADLGVELVQVLCLDDGRPGNVEGASEAGLGAGRFESSQQVLAAGGSSPPT